MSIAGSSPERANANIARYLGTIAAAQPGHPALKVPRGRTRAGDIAYLTLTFAELEAEVSAWVARLTARGVAPGDRTLVMVRPGLPLIASVFALFRLGAVPVVIDPGIGRRTFLACVVRSKPRALVGIPIARLMSHVFRKPFRSVRIRVAASSSLTARLTDAPRSRELRPGGGECSFANPEDLAAILFTSGSTGAPKGVCYEHGMFDAQVRTIRDTYGIAPGEIDLPLLPIFALFNPALGMTTVVPEIDPRRPAEVNPAKVVQAIQQERVTNSFGSPTLWRKIIEHCRRANIALPSLRRVLCAGAPVPETLWKDSGPVLERGLLHSPYGATEALPVATISAKEIDPTSVRGACVGRPVIGTQVRIIAMVDEPIRNLADASELPRGEIGEIIVSGAVVTRTYDALPATTLAAKIHEAKSAGADVIWHRMGDCGYLDAGGFLWFCGRKAERVETGSRTLHTEPCEQVFRRHPRVPRCALIGLGERPRQTPAIVVEADVRPSKNARHFARELRALALEHEHTASIMLFYFRPSFPVDVRHNAKIHRLALARWAATATGITSDPKR